MAVGVLEAFGLIEQHGAEAQRSGVVSMDELLDAAKAKKCIGCHSIKPTIVLEQRVQVIELGKRIKKWKDAR